MKNTAFIHNDGVCVFFNSKINIGKTAKVLYVFFNVVFIVFYIMLVSFTIPDKPTGGAIISIFVLLPAIYIFTLGKSTLWNFFGEEYIVINLKSISYSRNYGFFKTELKTIPFKRLNCQVNLDRTYEEESNGTLSFTDYNHNDVPIVIFTSSVFLPGDILDEVVDNLSVIYSIEHLTKTGENYIHLN